MIRLGEIRYDSADSGPGIIEVLSEDNQMWIKIHKFGPDHESNRSFEMRDRIQDKVIKLSNRNLELLGIKNTQNVWEV